MADATTLPPEIEAQITKLGNSIWKKDQRDAEEALRALLAPLVADRERVEWQEANGHVEIVTERAAEEGDHPWRALLRSGGVNDTEWETIASGDTWRAAIDAARGAA